LTSGLMIFYGIFGLYALEKFSYGPEEVGVIIMLVGLVNGGSAPPNLLARALCKPRSADLLYPADIRVRYGLNLIAGFSYLFADKFGNTSIRYELSCSSLARTAKARSSN
jgi:hypothetical protein